MFSCHMIIKSYTNIGFVNCMLMGSKFMSGTFCMTSQRSVDIVLHTIILVNVDSPNHHTSVCADRYVLAESYLDNMVQSQPGKLAICNRGVILPF